MSVKFSEDIVPISDLKANPSKIVRHVTEKHRPVLLTSRGRGVAIVQNLEDFEAAEEERAFMRAIVKGIVDLEEGREKKLRQNKNELGLK